LLFFFFVVLCVKPSRSFLKRIHGGWFTKKILLS